MNSADGYIEKQRIAEELRHYCAYGDGSLGEWYQKLQDVVLEEIDFPKPLELFNALAELIDCPSCHVESVNTFTPFSSTDTFADITFSCGHIVTVSDVDIEDIHFCPECGAKGVKHG